MPQELITRLLSDLEAFHQASDRELETLRTDGFLSVEHYESVKNAARDLLKPLESILSKAKTSPQTAAMSETTVASIVDRYKTFVTQQLGELYESAYTSKHLKQQMREFVQTHISEISARIRAERDAMPFLRSVLTQLDHVKAIKATIDQLQSRLIHQFESALQQEGNANRLSLFQDALERFEEGMCQIVDCYFMDQDSPRASNGNGSPCLGQQEFAPSMPGTTGVAAKVEVTSVGESLPITSAQQLQQICQEAVMLTTQLRALSHQSDRIVARLQELMADSQALAKQ
jgi:hypothetical protein